MIRSFKLVVRGVMENFKILFISEDTLMKEKIAFWMKECISDCKYNEILWSQMDDFEAVVLDCAQIEDKNRIYNMILNLRCLKNEILILLIGVSGSLQDRTNLLKAGADDLLQCGYTEIELQQKIRDLKNIFWYKKWKREKGYKL